MDATAGDETHGGGDVVLCVVRRHGLWLGRIGGISEEGGGAGHGGEDGGKMERSKVGSDKSCCGHRPAANHRSPISAATPGTSGNMCMWNELRNSHARDCFLCASTTE